MLALRETAQQTPSLCSSNWCATKSERALLGESLKTYAASAEDGRLAPRRPIRDINVFEWTRPNTTTRVLSNGGYF